MSESVYTLADVRHAYDRREVLAIDRLDVAEGEILGLVGPSGAGKSTLLRLLGLLEQPDAGSISYRGQLPWQERRLSLNLRRRVTMVFQQPYLLNRSVFANVEYGLRLRRLENRRSRVEAMLSGVGLDHLAHQRARSLSGGEAQRVAMARALVLEPDVLLLDEPTANLDPHNVAQLERIIREANETHGTTVVLVTHNVFQARRLAHRVGLLLDGRLVEVCAAGDFFDAPRDSRTAAFVAGDMIY
jgi:tungstate transport system ATP-binding protein